MAISAPQDDRRYHGLDALRGAMMMLGVVLHGAMFYLTTTPAAMPIPLDRNNSPIFDLLFHFIHSFRMPLFFVLAGYFASLLVEKRGLWGTWKNRAARILGPLLAGVVTVLPFVGLFMVDFMVSVRFGIHELIPDRTLVRVLGAEMKAAGFPVEQVSVGHLWFLYYLCYFYLLIPVCRYLVRKSLPAQAPIGRFVAAPAALGVFGLLTAATLWPFRGAQVHDGFIFLTPHPAALAYYGSFFVLGYFFHAHRGILQAFARYAGAAAALALVLFPLSLWLSHLDKAAAPPEAMRHAAAALSQGLCTWALIYAFTGAALRYFDREGPWILYVSQSSYWVFLWHLPAVCLAGWLLVPYDLPAVIKFSLVVAFTTVVCFVTYHYLVQKTWISVFLNGRRFDLDWPWRTQGAKAP